MNPVRQIQRHGQSIWLDYIRRSLMASGELARLIEDDGLRGVTSNPTIFQKAIAGSREYDEALAEIVHDDPHAEPGELFERVAVADIRRAADAFAPVHEETGGADGFVSLEVSPHLADDTEGTVREARRLWKAVDRSNLMVKVPATPAGIPAIETLIGEGINVNVTLIFSLDHYEAVARAYLRGLERAPDPSDVASVASFFISRVDGAVDPRLDEIGTDAARALRGQVAVANARAAYGRFRELFHGPSFTELRGRGGRVQRPLWASTGTKDPAYSDVLYVEELVGPETVNTVPPGTLTHFRNHGRARNALGDEGVIEAARERLERLEALGVDLAEVTATLQEAGVEAFKRSFDELVETLSEARDRAVGDHGAAGQHFTPPTGGWRVNDRLDAWEAEDFGCRIWRKDPTLWAPEPVPELEDRLGWLDLPASAHEELDGLTDFVEDVRDGGIEDVVLLGMGGSSLAPEVFRHTFGVAPGHPDLTVLDSTHPDAVRAVEAEIDPGRTLFLVSSKSGTTAETLSLFRYFWHRVASTGRDPGPHFTAITDPGTPLAELARERRFRRLFLAPSDVGGRYAALSVFGLVPAALVGVDVHRLIDRAWALAEGCAFCVPVHDNSALALGAALAEEARAGRNKLTFLADPKVRAFPSWLEQLVAESTGKDGRGIVPVAHEPGGGPGAYGTDRLFVAFSVGDEGDGPETAGDAGGGHGSDARGRPPSGPPLLAELEEAGHPLVRVHLRDRYDLGREIFRWELAVASAGSALDLHPFDQPDVERAKVLARDALERSADGGGEAGVVAGTPADRPAELADALSSWMEGAAPGGYVSIQAFVAPGAGTWTALQELRTAFRDGLGMATTLGYGPRYLHSTGQLHKGGPAGGLFLQLVDDPTADLPIPETEDTFGTLIRAQADGDRRALEEAGRPVLRVDLQKDPTGGIRRLLEALRHPESAASRGSAEP